MYVETANATQQPTSCTASRTPRMTLYVFQVVEGLVEGFVERFVEGLVGEFVKCSDKSERGPLISVELGFHGVQIL